MNPKYQKVAIKRQIVHRVISGCCPLCGVYRQRLQRDHIIPLCEQGSNKESNIQYICANCHEDKTRLEISRKLKGRILTFEHKSKIGDAHRGKPKSEYHRMLLRMRKHTDEAKAKMSAAHKGKPWSILRRKAQQDRKALNG